MLEAGLKGTQTWKVDKENTAIAVGSGTLNVLATPAMIALMEKTAWMSVADELEEGCSTVGISLNVTHDAPTPVGMEITCESVLTEVDGRKLTFSIEARDERGLIGKADHKRFIVNDKKFQEKADSK
jgi:predicted thioesterase